MFIGHFAPAFAARAITSEAPKLGTLFIAAQFVDWAFFILVSVGIENMRIVPGISEMMPFDLYHVPYTHSLAGTAGFAAIFAAFVYFTLRNAIAATWAAIVVMSHWILDWLVHIPDLTIAGTAPKLGLGLWNHPAIAIPLELAITGIAFFYYLRRTRGPVIPPLILMATLVVFQALNWFVPAPAEAGFSLYAAALFAFGVLTAIASWVGMSRWHCKEIGLDVASPRF